MPAEVRDGKSPARAHKEGKLVEMIRSGELSGEPHADLNQSHTMRVAVGDTHYEVQVAQVGDRVLFTSGAPVGPGAASPTTAPGGASSATSAVTGTPLKAPMPGVVISSPVCQGDAVKKGDPVMIIEAMKMENTLQAPCDGVVTAIEVSEGDTVEAGTALFTVDPPAAED